MPERSPQTREQMRAAKAHDLISKIKDESHAKDFGRQCVRLPSLIHQCGLCQAVAFLEAKNYGKVVVDFLAQVMSATESDSSKKLDAGKLAKQVREAAMIEYQWLTREALRSSQWLKRYSEGVLNVRPGEDHDTVEQQ